MAKGAVLRGAREADDASRLARVTARLELRLTSACTRPPTRRLLNSFCGLGRRVMPGVRRFALEKVLVICILSDRIRARLSLIVM
jgi:hypothetical protein